MDQTQPATPEHTSPLDDLTDEQRLDIQHEADELRRVIRNSQHRYRHVWQWREVREQRLSIDELLERAANDLDSGNFWLSRIGRVAETDRELVMALLVIRERWKAEFNATTTADILLIDQALIALYHQLRLHELIGNVQARVEMDYFDGQSLTATRHYTRDELPRFQVDEHLDRLRETLIPALERLQRMLSRSLRDLRDNHRVPLTIHNQGQINVADRQVNLAQPPRRNARKPRGASAGDHDRERAGGIPHSGAMPDES